MSSEPGPADYFDSRVAAYDEVYDACHPDGYLLRARLAAVLDLAGLGPGESLDAGMGPGRLCAELVGRGWTVSGVDGSEEMVAAARARIPDARDRLLCGPIESLPFANESFDLVTATGVLEYADLPRALAELARVTRPGGRSIVSYPNPRAVYGIWKTRLWYPLVRTGKRISRRRDPSMPRGGSELPPRRFIDALERAGWEPRTSVYTGYLPLVTPLERLVPSTSVRLGEWLERRNGRGRAALATQVVYESRRGAAVGS
jgi:SAM-dependent methyltransferase